MLYFSKPYIYKQSSLTFLANIEFAQNYIYCYEQEAREMMHNRQNKVENNQFGTAGTVLIRMMVCSTVCFIHKIHKITQNEPDLTQDIRWAAGA